MTSPSAETDGLDAGDLDAGGEDALEVHHDGGPGEAFALEEGVEEAGAVEHGAVGGLAHAAFVVLALGLEGEGLGAERVHAGLGGVRRAC